MPTRQKVEEYKRLVRKKYPVLKNVWVAMDGLKLRIERPPDHEEQMKYYNGWKHDHYISNVICFAPDGTIPCAYLNCPGSLHDSNVARQGGLYNKLKKVYEATGGMCVADSAFSSYCYMIISQKNLTVPNGPLSRALDWYISVKKKQHQCNNLQSGE